MWLNQDKAANTAVTFYTDLNTLLKNVNVVWEKAKSCGKQGVKTAGLQIVAMNTNKFRR